MYVGLHQLCLREETWTPLLTRLATPIRQLQTIEHSTFYTEDVIAGVSVPAWEILLHLEMILKGEAQGSLNALDLSAAIWQSQLEQMMVLASLFYSTFIGFVLEWYKSYSHEIANIKQNDDVQNHLAKIGLH